MRSDTAMAEATASPSPSPCRTIVMAMSAKLFSVELKNKAARAMPIMVPRATKAMKTGLGSGVRMFNSRLILTGGNLGKGYEMRFHCHDKHAGNENKEQGTDL